MAYIGNSPVIGNFQVCDAISVVNGQAAYTMQVDSANVTPESANHMLVSLNGILQKPGSSFTISGSTITFASNLATGDVIDFIMLLGNVLDIGTPSDATVTNAKTNFTSTSSAAGLQIKGDGTTDGTLQLNCSQNSHGIKLASPAHSAGQSYTLKFPTGNVTADKVLKVASVTGSGTTGVGQLSFADAGGGMFEHITTTTISNNSSVDFTSLDSTYSDFMITGQSIVLANDDEILRFRMAVSGSFVTSGTYSYATRGQTGGAEFYQDSNSASEIRFFKNIGNASGECAFFQITAYDVHSTTVLKGYHSLSGGFTSSSTPAGVVAMSAGGLRSTSALTGFKIYQASGNLTSGKISLYGRKRS